MREGRREHPVWPSDASVEEGVMRFNRVPVILFELVEVQTKPSPPRHPDQ